MAFTIPKAGSDSLNSGKEQKVSVGTTEMRALIHLKVVKIQTKKVQLHVKAECWSTIT